MVATVRMELDIEAELAEALRRRSDETGVPVGNLVSNLLRDSLVVERDGAYYRNGVRLIRKPGTGRKITAEEIIALWEELD